MTDEFTALLTAKLMIGICLFISFKAKVRKNCFEHQYLPKDFKKANKPEVLLLSSSP